MVGPAENVKKTFKIHMHIAYVWCKISKTAFKIFLALYNIKEVTVLALSRVGPAKKGKNRNNYTCRLATFDVRFPKLSS